MDLEFEKYVQKKLHDDHDMLENLPYTKEQLKEIYRSSYEYEKRAPVLKLKIEPQPLDNDTVRYYLPEKWEMPREGKLLYSDQELQRVLKLLIFNLGIEKALNTIPLEQIERYINNFNKR